MSAAMTSPKQGGRRMECRLCSERVKNWNGDDPSCAFKDGKTFDTDNWNCATMNELRDMVETRPETHGARVWHNDSNVGVLRVPDNEDGSCGGMIVLGWYKSRGRTEWACVYPGGESLTLEVADAMIAERNKAEESRR